MVHIDLAAGTNSLVPESRTLERVGAISGVAAVAGTSAIQVYIVYKLLSNDPAAAESTVWQTIVLLSALLFAMFTSLIVLSVFYSKRSRTIRDKSVTIALLEADNHRLNASSILICNTFDHIAKEQYEYCSLVYRDSSLSETQIVAHFITHLDRVLANVAKIFGLYTGFPSAACVKIFVDAAAGSDLPTVQSLTERPKQYVRTLRRDVQSHSERKGADSTPEGSSYRYQKNSAFHHIVDNINCPDYYVQNDLDSLGAEYENSNLQRRSHYNAVLVVPIKPPNKPAHEICAGFLCVDNLKGGFNTDECVYMLEEVATMIYLAMELTVFHLSRKEKDDR